MPLFNGQIRISNPRIFNDFSRIKARKQWQNKNHQSYYVKRLKDNMRELLNGSVIGVGAMVLVKGVILLETIFEGEYADA